MSSREGGWITRPLQVTTAPASFRDTETDSRCVVVAAEGTCSLAGGVVSDWLVSSAVTPLEASSLEPEVVVGKILMKRRFRRNSPLGVDTMYERQTGFETTCPVSWRSSRKTVAPSGSGGRERAPWCALKLASCLCLRCSSRRRTAETSGTTGQRCSRVIGNVVRS